MDEGINFNYENLFLILKCYFLTNRIYIHSMYFIMNNIDNKDSFFTYKKINHSKISKMSKSEFIYWIEDFLEVEKEYIKSYDFYGFRILFYAESIISEENSIFPIYP